MFRYDHCSLELPDRLYAANRMMLKAMHAGDVPKPRSPLVGIENAIFAFSHDKPLDAIAVAAFYQPDGTEIAWLDLLYVLPEFRRRGIGAELLRRVHAQVYQMGLPELQLGTLAGNLPMQALATKVGFEPLSITLASKVA